ncbi:MAG TPA: peptidylprolyl isomerase [Actinomycetota bacterium]|nr:peptidylprolyl isomerase [Actinomycetota bacterium]
MANKRTRERQLAKLAARRQAERAGQIRRRNRIVAGAAGIVAAAVVATAGFALIGDDDEGATSPTPSVTTTPEPTVACHADVPKAAAKQKRMFEEAPKLTIDPRATNTATMVTSCGRIVIELDARSAPETVNSFAFLADKRFYDGLTFHRIDSSIDVIQGGDPQGDGLGGPGYTIPDELTGDEAYVTGTLAMANAGPDTGGSQFFIVYGLNGKSLPPNFTIFGHVIEGLDVAKKIARIPIVDPNVTAPGPGQQPSMTVYIESVTVEES